MASSRDASEAAVSGGDCAGGRADEKVYCRGKYFGDFEE
jgi:hypothetical protein